MSEPRYKQYAEGKIDKGDEPKRKSPGSGMFVRSCMSFMIILFVIAILGLLAFIAPVKVSTSGDYVPPKDKAMVGEFDQPRWAIHDAQRRTLEASIAWYTHTTGEFPKSVAELDLNGFRPFIFENLKGEVIPVLTQNDPLESAKESFLFQISRDVQPDGGIIARRTVQNTNIFGRKWKSSVDKSFQVNPDYMTKKHTQNFSKNPPPEDSYSAFLCELFESASIGFVSVYHRMPANFDELLDGIGLVPNPNCELPFTDPAALKSSVECGVIGKDYFYWAVKLIDGTTYNRAWKWDYFLKSPKASSFDPSAQTTVSGITKVEDVKGERKIFFNEKILLDYLK